MQRKPNNNDVPIETILRHTLKEKGQLESEIAYLEDENKKLRKMIADFKKWQSHVATYKYSYWLTQGLELMEQKPPYEEISSLRRFFGTYQQFDYLYKKLLRMSENLDVYSGKLKNTSKPPTTP